VFISLLTRGACKVATVGDINLKALSWAELNGLARAIAAELHRRELPPTTEQMQWEENAHD